MQIQKHDLAAVSSISQEQAPIQASVGEHKTLTTSKMNFVLFRVFRGSKTEKEPILNAE